MWFMCSDKIWRDHHRWDQMYHVTYMEDVVGVIRLQTALISHYEHILQNVYMVRSPDSKVHGANMGPTWVLSAPDGPHVGPMNLAIRGSLLCFVVDWFLRIVHIFFIRFYHMIALMQMRNSWRIWVNTSHESTRAVDSLAPGRFKVNFRWVIFKLILVVNDWGMSCETALIWMSLDHIYGELTLVQAMAWCRPATSHYLSQCWPRSLSPYGVTRPQWFNITTTKQSTTKPIAHIMGLTICAIMFQAALLLHLPRRSHERSLW